MSALQCQTWAPSWGINNTEDVETVQAYEGPIASLGKAEQFFHAVASVPRQRRAHVLAFSSRSLMLFICCRMVC